MQAKTLCNFPKFYICKYGAFYEGEELYHYAWSSGNNYHYVNNIILEKFVVHYYNYVPVMYFRFHEVGKKQLWTLPCDNYLGIFYKKIPKRYCK